MLYDICFLFGVRIDDDLLAYLLFNFPPNIFSSFHFLGHRQIKPCSAIGCSFIKFTNSKYHMIFALVVI